MGPENQPKKGDGNPDTAADVAEMAGLNKTKQKCLFSGRGNRGYNSEGKARSEMGFSESCPGR